MSSWIRLEDIEALLEKMASAHFKPSCDMTETDRAIARMAGDIELELDKLRKYEFNTINTIKSCPNRSPCEMWCYMFEKPCMATSPVKG